MAGSHECGNEPLGPVKCREFLDYLRTCQLVRNDPAVVS
jgi:hypothetical protein